MTSPFSRPARPGFDRQNVNFVVEPRFSEEIGPGCLGRSPHRPVAVICVQEGLASSPTVPCRRTSTWSPGTTVPYSLMRIPSSTTSPVPRFSFHCSLRYETWAVEGMAVTRRFLRAPDQSCCIAVSNIHFNTECAKRRSVCSALLLLIRDLCLKFGAVVLTGDFNKAVERGTSSSDGERRTSQMEAGHEWPDCCRFMVLPESQSQWLILRHGSINVILADVGLTATDKTWHNEQWLHLKFAGRKRRRDAFFADAKSRQILCWQPTNERLFVVLSHP